MGAVKKVRSITKITCGTFTIIAGCIWCAEAQVTLVGSHIITSSSGDFGNLTISSGDLAVAMGSGTFGADLSVGGRMDVSSGIDLGTTISNVLALSVDYDSALKTATVTAAEAGVTFLWKENADVAEKPKMALAPSNILSLLKSDGGQPGIILDPNTSRLTFSSSGSGTGIYVGSSPLLFPGVGGAATFGSQSQIIISNSVASTSSATGSLTTEGGIGAKMDSHFNGVRVGTGGGNRGENTVLGHGTLAHNTGWNHVAIGYRALASNTTGISNVAIGREALVNNTVGRDNIAIGLHSLASNVGGWDNVAIGKGSLHLNSSGISNTAVGINSLFRNTVGADNLALGYASLYYNEGLRNSAGGNYSLFSNTTGSGNTSFGHRSGQGIVSGSGNVAIGENAGGQQTNGTYLTDPERSIYIGTNSKGLSNDDYNSIVIGYGALGEGANTTVIGNASTVRAKVYGVIDVSSIKGSKISVEQVDSAQDALSVEGTTRLNGKVIISVPQGDISMGIYQ